MRIGLVADVPDDSVFRGVVQKMERQGQLHRPESGREVAGGLRDAVDQETAQLPCHRGELGLPKLSQVRWRFDLIEKGISIGSHCVRAA